MDVNAAFIALQVHRAFQTVALPDDVSALATEQQRIVDRVKGLSWSQVDAVSLKAIQEVGIDTLTPDYFRFFLPSILWDALQGDPAMILWAVTILTPDHMSPSIFDSYVDVLWGDQRAVVYEFFNWVNEFQKGVFVDADSALLAGLWFWKEWTEEYVSDRAYTDSRRTILNELITDMFPKTIPFGPGKIVLPYSSDLNEPYILKLLEGKSWTQLTNVNIQITSSYLYYLSGEAFCYYLPAFLITLLDPNRYSAHDELLKALSPKPSEMQAFDTMASRLSKKQQQLIWVVLRFLEQQGDLSGHETKPYLRKALDYWG